MYGQSSSQDGTVALHGRAPYRTEVSILFLWLEASTLWWEVETQQPPESTSVLWASLPVYPVLSAQCSGSWAHGPYGSDSGEEHGCRDSTWFAVEIAEHLGTGHGNCFAHLRRPPAGDVVPQATAGCRERALEIFMDQCMTRISQKWIVNGY